MPLTAQPLPAPYSATTITHERHGMNARANFLRMQDSTREDWQLIGGEFAHFTSGLPHRVMASHANRGFWRTRLNSTLIRTALYRAVR